MATSRAGIGGEFASNARRHTVKNRNWQWTTVALLALLAGACGSTQNQVQTTPEKGQKAMEQKEQIAVITTPKGVIKFKFFRDGAPNTVDNFVKLASKGFYNGLTFHRVVPGFVIQGGDPSGDGTGGPGYSIKAEFNSHPHLEGSVAMARSADPDSAGSQFYICLGAQPFLDGKYTVFGQVTEGMDVVQKIRVGDVMTTVAIE
jgi:peptidyl-prolyl cis-trans isomerase B (cyclophilin B)